MRTQKMKTAVLGCGAISDAYLSTMINKFQVLDVVGCCDRNRDEAVKKAEEYGISAMTMEELLSDASVELVINLTPASAHYETTRMLLNAGKHVYSEKTLAVDLEKAAELVSLAKEKNLYLGCAPDTFLGAAVQTARYAVESGLIGQVSSFTASLTRDYRWFLGTSPACTRKGWGIAFDVGIYYVTALLSILGPVKTVSGMMETRDAVGTIRTPNHMGEAYTMECENIAAGTLKLDSGVIGTLLFDSNSVLTMPERPVMVLYGTEGILYMSDPNLFGGQVKVLIKGNSEPSVLPQSHPFETESRGLGAAEMAWSIRLGRKHRASQDMAYHALEVLRGIAVSGETGRQYQVQSTFEKRPALPRGYKNIAPEMQDTEEYALLF